MFCHILRDAALLIRMMASRRVSSRRRENGGAVPPRRASRERFPNTADTNTKKEAVYVCPRFAPQRDSGPMLDFETSEGGEFVLNHHTETQDGKQDIERRVHKFAHVFDTDATEEMVFHKLWLQAREKIADGHNATVLCYGQTGSGKTHTVKFLLPRLTEACFSWMKRQSGDPNTSFRVEVSYIQIYMDSVYDLLAGSKDAKLGEILGHKNKTMDALPKGFVPVQNAEEVFQKVRTGNKWRATNAHALNERSSRSHTLFFLTMSKDHEHCMTSTQSTLLVVDLAGSERVHKTKSTGERFEEGRAINKALTTLGRVMEGLSKNDRSIPFRENVLTMYLKETLTNSFFALICCCSSDGRDSDETRCTLKFGCVAKQVQITRKTNELLKARIQAKERKAAFDQTITNMSEQHEHEKKYLQGKYDELNNEVRSNAKARKQMEATLQYTAAERKELITSLHTLEQDSSYLQSLVSKLQQESKRKDDILKQLSTEVSQKDETHNCQVQTLHDTQNNLRNQLSEASSKVREADFLRQSNAGLLSQLELANDSTDNLKQDIMMLESELTDAQQHNEEDQRRRELLKNSISALEVELTDKDQETEHLKMTTTNLQKELCSTQQQLDSKYETISKLENYLSRKEEVSRTLQETVADLSTQLINKDDTLLHTEQLVAEERRTKESLQSNIREYEQINEELEMSIEKREKSISALVESQRLLQQRAVQLQSSVQDRNIIEKELISLRHKHSQVSEQIQEQRSHYETSTRSLERHIESMEQMQQQLQKNLNDSELNREEEVSQLTTAYHDISMLVKKEKERFQEEKINLRGHISSLEHTQSSLEETVAKLERDNISTRKEGRLLQEKLHEIKELKKKGENQYKEDTLYLESIIDKLEKDQLNTKLKLISMKEEESTKHAMDVDRHKTDINNLERDTARLQAEFEETKIAKERIIEQHQTDQQKYFRDINSLESQVGELHRACDSAQRQTADNQKQYDRDTAVLRSFISKLERERSQNENDLARLQDAFKDTQIVVSSLQSEKLSEREELERTISLLQKDASQLESLIKRLELNHTNDISRLSSENKQIKLQANQYAAEKEQLDVTQHDLRRVIDQVRSEKDEARKEITIHEEEKSELVKSQKNLESILHRLELEYTKTKSDALDIHEHFMDLEIQLVGEEDEKTRLAETAEQLSKRLAVISDEKSFFEEKVVNLESVAAQLSAKLHIAATARDAATTEIDELQRVLAEVQSKYQQQLSEIKMAKVRQRQLQERVSSVETELENKRIDCDDINRELAAQTTALECVMLSPSEKESLETEVAATKLQLREATTAASKMENELSILIDSHEAAVTLSETQSKRCDQLNSECLSGLQQLESARRSLQSLETSNRRIRRAHQQLINNTEELRSKEGDLKNLQNYKKTASQLEQKVSVLSSNNKNLTEKTRLDQVETRRLQQELRRKEKEILTLGDKLQRAELQKNSLEERSNTKIAKLQKSVSNLSDSVKGQGRSIDGYRGRVRDSERDSYILQHMLTRQNSQNTQSRGIGLGAGQRFSTTPVEYARQRTGSFSSGSGSLASYYGRSSSPLNISIGRKKTIPQFSHPPGGGNVPGNRRTYSFSSSPPAVVGQTIRSETQTYFKPSPQRVRRRSSSPSQVIQIAQRHSSTYGRPVPILITGSRSHTPQSRSSPLFVSRVPSRARSVSPLDPNAV